MKEIRASVKNLNNAQVEVEKQQQQEEEEEPLSPKGAIMHDCHFDSYILVIVGLTKQIHVPSLKAELSSTIVKHKRFCSVVRTSKNGNRKWVRVKEVDIDKHVVLPKLCETFIRDDPNFVENYTASLATAPPMDPSMPLWEVHVLNYKSGGGPEASVVFRIHHCIGDCMSLTSLFLHCTTKNSDPQSKPIVPTTVPKPKRSTHLMSFTRILWGIWAATFCLYCSVVELFHALVVFLFMKDAKCLIAGEEAVNHDKNLGYATVDLEDISLVRKTIGGTVNDVVTGMISAGFAMHFHRLKGGHEFSSDPRITALIPVNLRSSPGLMHKLERMMDEHDRSARWGNGFGLWILPICGRKQDKYMDYCRVAKKFLNRKKASIEARCTFYLTALISRLFGIGIGMHLPYRVCLNTALTFSNVQGPIEQVRLLDCPVTQIITTVGSVPQAIMVHFQSYAGKAKLICLASEKILPDPWEFCRDCAQALQVMKAEALKAQRFV